ncbi:DUF6378 domain-containing protein [Desulfovibrio gilichinskyi]|uniref:DUF6378 domain-containing protein n=1 Tax=Desulfovibrio gilichinskyi TaxID=1519643 RepID=A0A1X7C3D9_9BACT|nr:DUF6378 domain-containing protein [Desulfovibrio gilichinskyi]SME89325.1 hypothetical protein SAMN06295933_0274 [Desulfovibrio gilichinskyi]
MSKYSWLAMSGNGYVIQCSELPFWAHNGWQIKVGYKTLSKHPFWLKRGELWQKIEGGHDYCEGEVIERWFSDSYRRVAAQSVRQESPETQQDFKQKLDEFLDKKIGRGSILDKAKVIINGERQDQYGNPEDSFKTIAAFWTPYLRSRGLLKEDRELTPKDVAMLMVLLKIGRESQQEKLDNLVDLAGYAGIAGDMSHV